MIFSENLMKSASYHSHRRHRAINQQLKYSNQ
nr:MAG TPA: ParD-like antitoxin of type II bacterial toxin-antitoxin system [Caudoviricetes sp.]